MWTAGTSTLCMAPTWQMRRYISPSRQLLYMLNFVFQLNYICASPYPTTSHPQATTPPTSLPPPNSFPLPAPCLPFQRGPLIATNMLRWVGDQAPYFFENAKDLYNRRKAQPDTLVGLPRFRAAIMRARSPHPQLPPALPPPPPATTTTTTYEPPPPPHPLIALLTPLLVGWQRLV